MFVDKLFSFSNLYTSLHLIPFVKSKPSMFIPLKDCNYLKLYQDYHYHKDEL